MRLIHLNWNRLTLVAVAMLAVLAFTAAACGGGDEETTANDTTAAPVASEDGATQTGLSADVTSVVADRGLSPDDILAAVKTYVPSGVMDEYIMFASGGHSGQVFVIGMPSMRLLKVIGVFTPEPWQGYGLGSVDTMEVIASGDIDGQELRWGDTHHPALSETGGEYDGQWLFVNDKANARVAVIDLKDFETKQIIKNPLTLSDHGAAMVTPDTDWVIEGGQFGQPLGYGYAPLEDYEEKYRGMLTFWKFDRETGRILPEQSFAMELPPYWQDLCDAGKLASAGFIFCGSFNTEMATGGVEKGEPPFEAGASQRDMDYMHVIDLDKAVAVAAAGKTEEFEGFPVIRMDTSVAEGLLYLVPEPKSPHGVDIDPTGEFIIVSGKLDPHVTIYAFDKIKAAIAAGGLETDTYGIGILAFDDVMETQIEVGLGPLHTQFDDKGYAYTSLFLDSQVARWTMGGVNGAKNPEPDWTLVSTVDIHYNVGHIVTAEGDTVSPDGKYMVSLNKWSLDRFASTGPLLPQNFQLVDIAESGKSMQLLYDMPIGNGEPHYAQIIKADKLDPWDVYPEIGWNPGTQSIDPNAVLPGEERIERNGNTIEIFMTAVRSHFTPEHVEIKKGDHVIWHITNVERALDATHGFALPGYNINVSIEPGEAVTMEFDADKDGTFAYYCTEFCSALHLEMAGYFLVEP
jgi:nitrous-oxide reductase